MLGWATAALDLLYPALCPVCLVTRGAEGHDPLCAACWRAISRVQPPFCARCGAPFFVLDRLPDDPPAHATAHAALCSACAADPPPFDYARAAALYTGPLREALQAFKFGRKRALARPLAELVIEGAPEWLSPGVAALVPVPLTAARERERGFNQAALLAERVGAALGVAVDSRGLRRVRATQPQTDLAGAERRLNVRGAFAAARRVAGRHVIVIDDVLTTGATAAECARALRATGARTVGVVTVARVV